MPRKKPPFRVRTVYVSDPNPELKQNIREDLTARLRPRLSRDEVWTCMEELIRARNLRRISPATYAKQYEALRAEARRDPKRFWEELGNAFDTYSQRARLRPAHRALDGRLEYIEKALATLKPQTRLKSSRVNLAKAIERTGVMPWEASEFPSTARVMLAQIVAERATKDHGAYQCYLMEERTRLKATRKALEGRAGPYLGKNLGRGRRSPLAVREFIVSVREILDRHLVPSGQWWQDVADVCQYFHPGRLTPPRKKLRPVFNRDLVGWVDRTFCRFEKDPHESLDTTFWFPTKEALRRLIRRT